MTGPTYPAPGAPSGGGPTYPASAGATYPASGGPPYSAPGDTATPDVGDVSVGQLLGNVSRDLSTLMRQELALAKAELKQEATKAGKGAGMLGGAGFAGYMVLLFLSFALWWALANVMDEGLSALIVAIVWAIIAAVLYTTGRGQLRSVNPVPERTVDTLKQVPDAVKPHEERS
ncbi:phage holin family protein [Actinophytocola sp.]|uniref:phage holin family protein n=1 Tax=Actinophytocola sp. TaxID=1872138 RepID=UPI00389A93DC